MKTYVYFIDLFDDTFMFQEEAQVVTRYAQEIISLEPRKEDIDHILSSHLLSMQALRDKQTREKEQIRQGLMAKRQRTLVREECNQGEVMEGQGNDHGRTHSGMKLVMFDGDQKLGQTKMADKDVEGQGDNGMIERLYPRLDLCEREQGDGHEPGEYGEGFTYKSSVEETSEKLKLQKEIDKDNKRAFNASDAWKMNGHGDDESDYPVNDDVGYSEMHDSVEEEEDWAIRQLKERSHSTVDKDIKVRILQ